MLLYPPPKYQGPGEVSAVLHRAGQGPDVEIGPGARIYYLGTGSDTDGVLGAYLCEFRGPDPGAVPHFHTTLTESFFVLAGTMQLFTGTAWEDAAPGDWMHVREGGIHGFRHQHGDLARMLLLFTPGAPREEFFAGLADLAAGRPLSDGEDLRAFMDRHDNHLLGPPPA
jgi:quercetin dioxygenase-like cupin family protein